EQPVEMDDHISHLGIVDRPLGLAAPGVLGRGIAVEDPDQVDAAQIGEVEGARILYPPAEYQVKLAHGRSLAGFAAEFKLSAASSPRRAPPGPTPWPRRSRPRTASGSFPRPFRGSGRAR